MSDRESVAVSVNDRLKAAARRMEGDPNRNLQFLQARFVYERTMARLQRGSAAGRWAIKGGVLMLALPQQVHRVTMDMDWSALPGRPLSVTAVLGELCAMPADPEDGLSFSLVTEGKSAPRVIREESASPTVRATLEATLHCAKPSGRKFVVDVTNAEMDFVPMEVEWSPTVRGFEPVVVSAYPWELVAAEKVHAILTGTMSNSRLRDYMDVIALERSGVLAGADMASWIARVFEARGDAGRQHEAAVGLSPDFATERQVDWTGTLNRTGYAGRLPASLADAIEEVRVVVGGMLEPAAPTIPR